MAGQVLDYAATFDAANQSAPTVALERAVDVHRHRVGGVRPRVLLVIGTVGLFLEIELIHRVGAHAIRQTGQETRHGQADVARILRRPQ
ncbi:hypothetical protein D3C85_1531510 [compost metagenome]